MSIGELDMEPQISEHFSSWDQRRAERRQRYREEKSRLTQTDDVELEDLESQETITEDVDDRTPTGQFGEQEFILVSSAQEPEENLFSKRKYSIPEEIRVAHSTCSRRSSVQITDLDEQWYMSTVHVEEVGSFHIPRFLVKCKIVEFSERNSSWDKFLNVFSPNIVHPNPIN